MNMIMHFTSLSACDHLGSAMSEMVPPDSANSRRKMERHSSHLVQLTSAELQALLDDVGRELLLRQVAVVPEQVVHDCNGGVGIAQLQHVLHYVVAKRILHVPKGRWLLADELRTDAIKGTLQERRCS